MIDKQELIAKAWDLWYKRHGGKLGPGPAFREIIEMLIDEITKEIEKDSGSKEIHSRRTEESS